MANKTFKVTEEDILFLIEKNRREAYEQGKSEGFIAGYNAAAKAARLNKRVKEQCRNLYGKIS